MDLLLELYGLNVLKGWGPVMYDLRIRSKQTFLLVRTPPTAATPSAQLMLY
jgi:hypothetical protein